MRRSVVTTMSGVSLVVVGLSVRASTLGASHRVAAASVPVGIVAAGPPSTAPVRAHARSARPRVRRTSAPVATHQAVVQRSTTAAAPRRTAAPRVTHSASPKPAPVQTYTVTGDAVDSGYGPVQVQVQIRNHRIVSADAIDYPQGDQRSASYSSCAIPRLNQATMQAQSANIDTASVDTVCGASHTSSSYQQSLQAALDQAHAAGIF